MSLFRVCHGYGNRDHLMPNLSATISKPSFSFFFIYPFNGLPWSNGHMPVYFVLQSIPWVVQLGSLMTCVVGLLAFPFLFSVLLSDLTKQWHVKNMLYNGCAL